MIKEMGGVGVFFVGMHHNYSTCTSQSEELGSSITTSLGLISIRASFTLVKNVPSGKQTRLFIISYPSVYSLGGARKHGSAQSLKIKNYTYFDTTKESVLRRFIDHTTPPNF